MSFSSGKEPVPLQGPAGCLHSQIPGVLVLPPLHYRWEQEHPELPYQPHKVQLSPWQEKPGAVSTMGIKPRKPASAPKKASSSGSASLLRELTKKLLKNLFKITYLLLEGLLSSL